MSFKLNVYKRVLFIFLGGHFTILKLQTQKSFSNRYFCFILNLAGVDSAKKKDKSKENTVGRPVKTNRDETRKQFFDEHLNEIVVNGKLAPYNSDIFEQLRKLCGSNNTNTEYLAASRYLKRIKLIPREEQCEPEEDEEYTAFGPVSVNGEEFTVDISGIELFRETGESKLKEQQQFNDHLIKLIFEHTHKPCCWSFGRVFTQSDDIKIHAVCLNENCNATLIIFTESQQSRLRMILYNYDSNVQHSKKRYLTGSDEKQKVEALLAIESAMVTRAKLANEYIFTENEYAAHLCFFSSVACTKASYE